MVLVDWLLGTLEAQLAALAIAAYGLFKYRQLRSVAMGMVSAVGTVGFVGMTLLVAGAVGVAFGWLDVGAMLADVGGIVEAVWTAIGPGLVDWLTGLLAATMGVTR